MQARGFSLLIFFILSISIKSFSQISTFEAIIVKQAETGAALMRLLFPFLGCMSSVYIASELSFDKDKEKPRHYQNLAVALKIVVCVTASLIMSYMCRNEYNRVPYVIVPVLGGIIGYKIDDCPKGTMKGGMVGCAGFLGFCAGTWATAKFLES